jgi:hypothetical protein
VRLIFAKNIFACADDQSFHTLEGRLETVALSHGETAEAYKDVTGALVGAS